MKIATRIALLYSLLLAPAALGGVIPRSSASDISFIRRASGDESETQRDAGQSRSLGEDGAEGQQESTKSDGGLIKRMAEEPEESDEASTAQELPTTSPSGLQNNLDVPLAPTTMAGGASKINVLPTTVEDGTMSMLPVPTLGAGSGVSAGVGSGAADSAAVSQLTMSDAVSSKTATSTGLSQVIGPAIATNAASGKSNDLNEPPPPLPDPPRRGEPPVPNAPAGLGGTQPAIPHAPSQSAVPVPTASQGGLPSSAVSPATPSSGSGHTTPSSGGSSSGNGSGSGSGSGASSGSPSTCSTTSKPLQAVQCLLDASPTCPLPGGGCGVLVELKPYIKTDIDACKDFVTLAAQVCAQCSGTEEMYDLYNAYLTRCGAAGDGGAGAVNNAESAEGEEQKGTGTPTVTTGGVQTADEVQSGAASSESAGDASSAAGQGTESESGSTPTDIATESGSANAVATSATSYTRTGSGAGSNASVTFTETSELSAKPTGGASSDDNQSASTTPGKVDANGDRWYDAGVRTGQAADGRGTSTPAQSGSASDVGDEGGKGPSSDSGAASVDSDATETEVTGAGASDATGTASKASATASAGGSDGVEPDATAPRQEGAASRPPNSMSMNASEQADGGAEGSDTKPRPSDSPSSANGVLADGSTDVPKNGTATGTDDLSVKSKSSATATSQGSKGTAETELQSPAMSETKRFFENEIDEACLDTGCQAWADAYKVGQSPLCVPKALVLPSAPAPEATRDVS